MIAEKYNKLLKIVVEEYIKTAKPVSSSSLCNDLNCSSATIRSEMGHLEELGFLEKTHISSGRIPSEKGYRYYVDNLMKPKEMTGDDMLKLQTIFKNKSLVLSDAISKSIEIISEITNYTAISLGDDVHKNNLKQVEVVLMNEKTLVAIIVTDKGYVENKIITIKEQVSLVEIKKIVDLINKLLSGTPINDIIYNLEFQIKPIIGDYIEKHETLYQAFYKAFNDFGVKSNVFMSGKINMLNQPEFDNTDKIKDILKKFDDPNLIKSIESDNDEINIYIGTESKFDNDVTIIKTQYEVDGEKNTIAIVGPKRMDYERVVGLLEFIKDNIER